MKWPFFLAVSFLVTHGVYAAKKDKLGHDEDSIDLPIAVGNTEIVRGNLTHQTSLILDEFGTVHILTVTEDGKADFFRISRRYAAKELIIYRGWPYILDKHGNLFALDESWLNSLYNKLPYISLRLVKKAPYAMGAAIATSALGFIDRTYFGLVTTNAFHPVIAMIGGLIVFYGVDIGYTVFRRTHRSIGFGGNFFRHRLAKGISKLERNENEDDFRIEIRSWRRDVKYQQLSELVPSSVASKSCMEFLTRLTVP